MRPTFYEPPLDQILLAALPANLFGTVKTSSMPSASPPFRSADLEPDEYGWVIMDDGSFYHVHAGIIANRHPFDQEDLTFPSHYAKHSTTYTLLHYAPPVMPKKFIK